MTTDTTPTTHDTATQDVDVTLSDLEATVDSYIAAWNETDPAARKELIAASIGRDLWYRDPLLEIDGRDAFDATMAVVQEQYPGHVMSRTSALDRHHDVVRFNWALGRPGEAPVFAGVDMAKYDGDGKLHRIVGFAGESIA